MGWKWLKGLEMAEIYWDDSSWEFYYYFIIIIPMTVMMSLVNDIITRV